MSTISNIKTLNSYFEFCQMFSKSDFGIAAFSLEIVLSRPFSRLLVLLFSDIP